MQKLVLALRQLEVKENFYKEQLLSYTTYLETCLNNIAGRNRLVTYSYYQDLLSTLFLYFRNVHQKKEAEKNRKNKNTVKYTGAKLHEKGVVIEIEDLPYVQLKNVLFEITPQMTTGVFQVQVKFMGVAMETVELNIQDLLQLQYEGVSVKKMMGKAQVNVNLLLHLLNTKFYSKKK